MSTKSRKALGNSKGSDSGAGNGVNTTLKTTRAPKGHRQKGAGTIIKDRPVHVTNDGVTLKSFERLPTQILQEYCQKEKRPFPVYVASRGVCQPHYVVILKDAKHEKDNLTFKPPTPEQNFESEKVAKDYAALIACFHFMSTLPLERKLPEPYRSAWMLLLSTATSGSKTKQGTASSCTASSGKRRSDTVKSNSISVLSVDSNGENRDIIVSTDGSFQTLRGTVTCTAGADGDNGLRVAKVGVKTSSNPEVPHSGPSLNACSLPSPPPVATANVKSSDMPVQRPAVANNLSASLKRINVGGGGVKSGQCDDTKPHAGVGSSVSMALSRSEKETLRLQKVAKSNARRSRLAAVMSSNRLMMADIKSERLKLYFEKCFRLCSSPMKPPDSTSLELRGSTSALLDSPLTAPVVSLPDKHAPEYVTSSCLTNVSVVKCDYVSIFRRIAGAVGVSAEESSEMCDWLAEYFDCSAIDFGHTSNLRFESESNPILNKSGYFAPDVDASSELEYSVELLASESSGDEWNINTKDLLLLFKLGQYYGLFASSLKFIADPSLTLDTESGAKEKATRGGNDVASLLEELEVIQSMHSYVNVDVSGEFGDSVFSSLLLHERRKCGSVKKSSTPINSASVHTCDEWRNLFESAAGSESGGGSDIGLIYSFPVVTALNVNGTVDISTALSEVEKLLDSVQSGCGTRGMTQLWERILGLFRSNALQLVLDIIIPLKASYPHEYSIVTPKYCNQVRESKLMSSVLTNVRLCASDDSRGKFSDVLTSIIRRVISQLQAKLGSYLSTEFSDICAVDEPCVFKTMSYVQGDFMCDVVPEVIKDVVNHVLNNIAGNATSCSRNANAISLKDAQVTNGASDLESGLGLDLVQDMRCRIHAAHLEHVSPKFDGVGEVHNEFRGRKKHPFWIPFPLHLNAISDCADRKQNAQSGALSVTPMLLSRQKLPAWNIRQAFTDLLCPPTRTPTAFRGEHSIIVTGETGSGKTTQIPQFIYEHFKGNVKMIICQPRRLAAVSVAYRVAEEMQKSVGTADEKDPPSELGGTVGYMIKGDVKASESTRILFCTYGVLLRKLQDADDAMLSAIDYILLDEVHERGSECDLVLALVRRIQDCRNSKSNNGTYRPLNLIVMSATISTDKVARYLEVAPSQRISSMNALHAENRNGAMLQNNSRLEATPRRVPIIHVAGRAFHVNEYFKQEYEMLLRDFTNEASGGNFGKGGRKNTCGGDYRPNVIGGVRRIGEIDFDLLTRLIFQLCGVGDELYQINQSTETSASTNTESTSNRKWLIEPCGDGESILIFMPGVPEINKLLNILEVEVKTALSGGGVSYGYDGDLSDEDMPTPSKMHRFCSEWLKKQLGAIQVLGLHGGMSQDEQKKIFKTWGSKRIKVGSRTVRNVKVIVSTNVAEASVTIPDVTVVIDSCKAKQLEYNSERNMTTLVTQFAAQDSLLQRKGRAGRVCEGRCFRLISSNTYNKLKPNSIPELLRIPLDSILLQIKSMKLCSLSTVLSTIPKSSPLNSIQNEECYQLLCQCLDAPPIDNVSKGLFNLRQLHAIEPPRNIGKGRGTVLTPLGEVLASLPCEPRIGRLLLYGVMFKCIVPALYLSALLSNSKGNPSKNKNTVSNVQTRGAGINSDHLRMLGLISKFHQLSMGQSKSSSYKLFCQRKQFCNEHQLTLEAMVEIVDVTYGDLVEELFKLHYLSESDRDLLIFKGTRSNGYSRNSEGSGSALEMDVECNRNGSKPKLVVALLTVGLYPNIAFILKPPKTFVETMGSNLERDAKLNEYKFFIPRDNLDPSFDPLIDASGSGNDSESEADSCDSDGEEELNNVGGEVKNSRSYSNQNHRTQRLFQPCSYYRNAGHFVHSLTSHMDRVYVKNVSNGDRVAYRGSYILYSEKKLISFVPGSSNILPSAVPAPRSSEVPSVSAPAVTPLDSYNKRKEVENISRAFVFDITEVVNPFTLLLLCGGVFNVLKRKTSCTVKNGGGLEAVSRAQKKNIRGTANANVGGDSDGCDASNYDMELPAVVSDDENASHDMGDVEDITDDLLAPLLDLEEDSNALEGRYYAVAKSLGQFKDGVTKGNVCSISSVGGGNSIGDRHNGVIAASTSEDTVIIIIDNHLTFTTDVHTATLLLYIRYFVMNILFPDVLSVSKDISKYETVLSNIIGLCCEE